MAILALFWGEQQATVAFVAVACIFSGINYFPRSDISAAIHS